MTTGERASRSTFRALSHRNFRLWIVGLLVSSIGTWAQITAQDWTVLTILTDNDAGALAVVVAAQTAPALLLLPVAGYVTDRIPRRTVLFFTQCVMGLAAFGLGAVVIAGIAEYWHVVAAAVVLGVAGAFDAPARQTFANDLVAPERLSNAIALGSATFNLARLIGPAIAGVAIGFVGPGWIFVANGVSFAALLIALWLMRVTEFHPVKRDDGSSGRWLGGIRYVFADRRILTLIVLVFVVIGMVGMSVSLLVITSVTIEFDSNAQAFGLLTSCVALGSIVGALFVASRSRPRLTLLIASAGGVGVALGAASLMPTLVSFAIVMPFLGFAIMSTMATCNAAVQTMVEPGMRGRVMGVYMAAWMAGAPLGALSIGGIVTAFGPRIGLACAAATVLLMALVAGLILRRIANNQLDRETLAEANSIEPNSAAVSEP